MPSYIPMTSATVALPKAQFKELEDLFQKRHNGSTYLGRFDMDKFLFERYLNSNRAVDQDCKNTLEKIKSKNVPDGRNIPKSQIDLMNWSDRTGGERQRDESGLFI
jgi:hypothetical protein